MRIVYLTHSLRSCWNHGNAHFLRGVLRELSAAHNVMALEPEDAWSLTNLRQDGGDPDGWRTRYPTITAATYRPGDDPAALIDGADLVIVHEWNDPVLVAALGRLRRSGRFTLLFHDTHHRAVSDPAAIRRYDLSDYDAVLTFGAALTQVYRSWGWGDRAFTWHEAADTAVFHPPTHPHPRHGAVWIGNWGDGEREAELESYLLAPTRAEGLPLDIHGVRYPGAALDLLSRYGATYRGWLPNHLAPDVFARHLLTVHVPRRYYTQALPGIPTIRVFEALACGIPLVCAPWRDDEALFTPGDDYLMADTPADMPGLLRRMTHEPELRTHLATHGLATIAARHTCAHRAAELLAIVDRVRATTASELRRAV